MQLYFAMVWTADSEYGPVTLSAWKNACVEWAKQDRRGHQGLTSNPSILFYEKACSNGVLFHYKDAAPLTMPPTVAHECTTLVGGGIQDAASQTPRRVGKMSMMLFCSSNFEN